MKRTILTIPNIITMARLLLVLSLPFFRNYPRIPFFIAIIIVLSDFEGVIARRLKQVTTFGAVLDKFVDVIFVTMVFLFFFDNSAEDFVLIGLILLSRVIKNILVKKGIENLKPLLFTKVTYLFVFAIILARLWGIDVAFLLKWLALLFWIEMFVCIFYYKRKN